LPASSRSLPFVFSILPLASSLLIKNPQKPSLTDANK
jgi:hypothetical protein